MANTIRDRVVRALDEKLISATELAKRANVSYSVIVNLKRRESSSTSGENAIRILEVLDGIEGNNGDGSGNPEDTSDGSALVRVYDIQAAAGNGFIPDAYEAVVDLLAFPQRYLSDITKTSPEHLAIIGVVGSSMQPTLNHGDVVMVDMTKTDIDFDGMFVVRIGEALKVKRVSYGAKRRSIIVRSDNPNKLQFPDEEYFQGDDIQVVGRVAWVGAKQP